jgi:hypothetical protein
MFEYLLASAITIFSYVPSGGGLGAGHHGDLQIDALSRLLEWLMFNGSICGSLPEQRSKFVFEWTRRY